MNTPMSPAEPMSRADLEAFVRVLCHRQQLPDPTFQWRPLDPGSSSIHRNAIAFTFNPEILDLPDRARNVAAHEVGHAVTQWRAPWRQRRIGAWAVSVGAGTAAALVSLWRTLVLADHITHPTLSDTAELLALSLLLLRCSWLVLVAVHSRLVGQSREFAADAFATSAGYPLTPAIIAKNSPTPRFVINQSHPTWSRRLDRTMQQQATATHTTPFVDGISIQGSEHPNQDTWGQAAGVVWVIDGATRPTSPAGTVETYVEDLSTALTDVSTAHPSRDLTQILHDAIATTATDQASATVAMARPTSTGTDYLVLGDATIYTPSLGTITDNRLDHIATDVRAHRAQERHLHGPSPRFHDLTRDLLATEDAWRNRPAGFWVAGPHPHAAHHAITGHCTDTEILLMTDGLDPTTAPHLFSSPDLSTQVTNQRARLGVPVDDITVVVASAGPVGRRS